MNSVAKRNLVNFCRIPNWNAVLSKDEVNELFEISGTDVFCNGRLRTIVATSLTSELFSVKTVPFL